MTSTFDHIENQPDNYFGCCPICGSNDGFVNIGREHWFRCHTHKVKWSAGDNLFSGWQHETPDIWEINRKTLASYTQLSANAADDGIDWDDVDAAFADIFSGGAL